MALAQAAAEDESAGSGTGEIAHLQARVEALEREMGLLRETVQRLCAELGMSQGGQS